MQKLSYLIVTVSVFLVVGCGNPKVKKMSAPNFIEIEVQNHIILHGFDEENKEILEEVTVEKPMKKLIRVDRIQSISEKYILSSYGYDRLIYWEYNGSYDSLKKLLSENQG